MPSELAFQAEKKKIKNVYLIIGDAFLDLTSFGLSPTYPAPTHKRTKRFFLWFFFFFSAVFFIYHQYSPPKNIQGVILEVVVVVFVCLFPECVRTAKDYLSKSL